MAKNDFRGRDSFSLGFLSLLDFPPFRLETYRASNEDLNISTVCQFLNFATVEILLNSLPFQACNYLYELLCYANDLMRFSKLRPCYCSGLVFRWRSLRSWLSKSARKSARRAQLGIVFYAGLIDPHWLPAQRVVCRGELKVWDSNFWEAWARAGRGEVLNSIINSTAREGPLCICFSLALFLFLSLLLSCFVTCERSLSEVEVPLAKMLISLWLLGLSFWERQRFCLAFLSGITLASVSTSFTFSLPLKANSLRIVPASS